MSSKDAIERIDYLKKCLQENTIGDDNKPLDQRTRKIFQKEVEEFNPEQYLEDVNVLKYMSCSSFGHLCPVYFVAESATESKTPRKNSRYISQAQLVRVVRRDHSTCQLCSKHLLDKDIEIDHIIPISKGGPTHESNLRVLCRKCNRSKSSKVGEILKRGE